MNVFEPELPYVKSSGKYGQDSVGLERLCNVIECTSLDRLYCGLDCAQSRNQDPDYVWIYITRRMQERTPVHVPNRYIGEHQVKRLFPEQGQRRISGSRTSNRVALPL